MLYSLPESPKSSKTVDTCNLFLVEFSLTEYLIQHENGNELFQVYYSWFMTSRHFVTFWSLKSNKTIKPLHSSTYYTWHWTYMNKIKQESCTQTKKYLKMAIRNIVVWEMQRIHLPQEDLQDV